MVGTQEAREARRVELANDARGLVDTQAEHAKLTAELRARRKAEVDRHRKELARAELFKKSVIDPAATKVRRASAAMGELCAQYVDRSLVTAEARARSAIATSARLVERQRVDIERARADVKATGKSIKGTQLERDLDRAELERAQEVGNLAANQRAWETARADLDVALDEVLGAAGGSA